MSLLRVDVYLTHTRSPTYVDCVRPITSHPIPACDRVLEDFIASRRLKQSPRR